MFVYARHKPKQTVRSTYRGASTRLPLLRNATATILLFRHTLKRFVWTTPTATMHKPRVRATARPDRARARRDDVRRDGSQRSFTDASAMYIHKFYNNLKLQAEQRVYASLHGYTARVDTRRCDADIYMLLFTFDYMESVFAVHHMHICG